MFDTYIILYSVLSIVLIEARRVIHELIRINSKKDLNNILVYIIRKLSPRKLQWKHDQVINQFAKHILIHDKKNLENKHNESLFDYLCSNDMQGEGDSFEN